MIQAESLFNQLLQHFPRGFAALARKPRPQYLMSNHAVQ